MSVCKKRDNKRERKTLSFYVEMGGYIDNILFSDLHEVLLDEVCSGRLHRQFVHHALVHTPSHVVTCTLVKLFSVFQSRIKKRD